MDTDFSAFTRRMEGFSAEPYFDTNGNLTIGYGSNLTMYGMNMEQAMRKWPHGISDSDANEIFLKSYNEAISDCRRLFPDYKYMPEARQKALVDLRYNMGCTGLAVGFPRFMLAVNRGDWTDAVAELNFKNPKADPRIPTKWRNDVKERRSMPISHMLLYGEEMET